MKHSFHNLFLDIQINKGKNKKTKKKNEQKMHFANL